MCTLRMIANELLEKRKKEEKNRKRNQLRIRERERERMSGKKDAKES